MKTGKRCLALALCLLFFFGWIAPAARAEETPEPERGYTLTVVEPETTLTEEGVPLAAAPVREESCCMLHFLLMLIAFGLVIVYAVDSKNRQQWLFRLHQELEI